MFKKLLIAAAFTMASSPTFVSAQDFFFSFDEFSRQTSLTQDSVSIGGSATGQVFIFADADLDFNQIDLDFTNSNPSVVQFTSGTAADSDGSFTAISVEDPNIAGAPITATDGRLFGVSFSIPPFLFIDGQDPFLSPFDAEFRPGADGFLLATIDFDVVGDGTANFDFILGDLGVVNDGVGQVPVDLDATGSFTAEDPIPCLGYGCFGGDPDDYPYYPYPEPEPEPEPVSDVPEPSSAILLILGAAGMAARRRRF